MSEILKGVFAASISVLKADLSLDIKETLNHAKKNLDNNGVGSAFFGSTGCGQLISISEKKLFINALSKENFKENILINFFKLVISVSIIYIMGILWLGSLIGWDKPIIQLGVTPFLLAELFKVSILALLAKKIVKLKKFI